MSGHVSALTLDALALDALDREAEHAVREHLAACAACRTLQCEGDSLREHFEAHVFARTLPALRTRLTPRRRRWLWLAAPAFAIAAIAVVVMQRREAPVIAIKGDAAWQVYANRNDEVFEVFDGTQLAAGDRIRFVVVPNGARYVLVASIDGAGAATIYYPYAGERSAPIDQARAELPGSITLDAAPGPERIYALFSDAPIDASTVNDRLRRIGARGQDAIRNEHQLDIAARSQLSLVFEKARP